MKRVYIAENLTDAYLVSNLIRNDGIETHVFNEFAHGAVGELPFTHTWPEVWVKDDRNESRALTIIASRQRVQPSAEELNCSACRQPNPSHFEICWNCSAILHHPQ